MKVFVDDFRPTPDGWVRVYTYEGAIEILKTGKVEQISLDNDLGTKKEGYDVAKWIERQVFETTFRPPKIWVHSSNPVAAQNIRSCIVAIERVAKRKRTFRGTFE